jgi:hypothetical protein
MHESASEGYAGADQFSDASVCDNSIVHQGKKLSGRAYLISRNKNAPPSGQASGIYTTLVYMPLG